MAPEMPKAEFKFPQDPNGKDVFMDISVGRRVIALSLEPGFAEEVAVKLIRAARLVKAKKADNMEGTDG